MEKADLVGCITGAVEGGGDGEEEDERLSSTGQTVTGVTHHGGSPGPERTCNREKTGRLRKQGSLQGCSKPPTPQWQQESVKQESS